MDEVNYNDEESNRCFLRNLFINSKDFQFSLIRVKGGIEEKIDSKIRFVNLNQTQYLKQVYFAHLLRFKDYDEEKIVDDVAGTQEELELFRKIEDLEVTDNLHERISNLLELKKGYVPLSLKDFGNCDLLFLRPPYKALVPEEGTREMLVFNS